MKQLLFVLSICGITSVAARSRTFEGFLGGAGGGALIGGLAGGGRGAGYGALAGGVLGTMIGASADNDRRRDRYYDDYYYEDDYDDDYPGYGNYAYASQQTYANRNRQNGYRRQINRQRTSTRQTKNYRR
jgi:hypothetical protein